MTVILWFYDFEHSQWMEKISVLPELDFGNE